MKKKNQLKTFGKKQANRSVGRTDGRTDGNLTALTNQQKKKTWRRKNGVINSRIVDDLNKKQENIHILFSACDTFQPFSPSFISIRIDCKCIEQFVALYNWIVPF